MTSSGPPSGRRVRPGWRRGPPRRPALPRPLALQREADACRTRAPAGQNRECDVYFVKMSVFKQEDRK